MALKVFVHHIFLRWDLPMPDGSRGGFLKKLRHDEEDFDIVMPPWSPTGVDSSSAEPQRKKSSWNHRLENAGVPFAPKQIHLEEEAMLLVVDPGHCSHVVHIQSSGAPYTDSFWVRLVYDYQATEDGLLMVVYHQTVFVKSPFVKGIITKRSHEEAVAGSKATYEAMSRFLAAQAQARARAQSPALKAEEQAPGQELELEKTKAELAQLRRELEQARAGFSSQQRLARCLVVLLVGVTALALWPVLNP